MVGANMVYKIGVVIGIFVSIAVLKWFENGSVRRRKAKKWNNNR
jgi:hypothetical protein